ncbi:putative anti-sigmaE protein [Chromobacterium violaceum]|uniref:Putative anti-sigmaE protein n=1 Tax=Chromobacterium violaceum TaxID=536 RepID=A0A3S4I856_CHRVL|nr:putative anti-sigmaE protein [Chromobacterium violaceum]
MTESNADKLQAYLDGELSPSEAEALEAWLERHPEAARQLEQWRRQDEALRELWALPGREPVPGRLLAAARPPARRAAPAWWRQGMAAGLVFALGLGGGWYGRLAYQADRPAVAASAPTDSFPRQAAMAHVVYSPDIQRRSRSAPTRRRRWSPGFPGACAAKSSRRAWPRPATS